MMSSRIALGLGSLLALVLLLGVWRTAKPVLGQSGDRIWHHRNLGKAFYENPTTQLRAVAEFKQGLDLAPNSVRERVNYGLALLKGGKTKEGIAELERAQQQDPGIPHTWFNLGIAFKRDSQYDRAIVQFEQMVKLAPSEPISHYNLGYLYKLTDRPGPALAEFETAARLDPNLAGPHFQLLNAYRDANRLDDSAREQKIFQDLKRRQAGAAVPEDLDWSYYSEIYDPLDAQVAKDDSPAATLKFEDRLLAGFFEPSRAGLLVLDADGDGRPDLLAWSGDTVRLFRNGTTLVEMSGLGDLKDVRGMAAGDFNNDGLADLCVLTGTDAALYINNKGTFQKADIPLPAGRFVKAVWLDYDHDYDLDLLLVGDKPALLRNNGRNGFSDQTADFPFVTGQAIDALVFNLVPNAPGRDVAIGYADRTGVIYKDLLGGKYEAQPIEQLQAGAHALVAEDVDDDGAVDLVAAGSRDVAVLLNRDGRWVAGTAPAAARSLAAADLESRALTDILAEGVVLRNEGLGRFTPRPADALAHAAVLATADFSGDGREDAVVVRADGTLHLLRNDTTTAHKWLKVSLAGVKNLKLAAQALVEVRAGARYQRKAYAGLPLVFGVRDATQVDSVRITWPNGLIQNETQQPVGRTLAYKEAQRLSGSCPMIFTWNGRGFQFITDVLGVAPLGARSGDGTFFPVDHDEYIQIPGDDLAAKDGAYEVRITEELREVSYLDHVQLIAVDHPVAIDFFTNDKFKSPPFPEFRLFGAASRVHPTRARDERGRDVRPALLARDRTYPDTFKRNYAGVAELHALDLDFGAVAPGNRAVLILNGWVDWADGSTFLGASQEDPRGLIFPSVQVKDHEGRWKTVVEDMGIPAGKPKTMAVDLTGRFLSASREVRIVTNLCVYWDEIFLLEDSEPPPVVLTRIEARSAELDFRGFSAATIHPARKQPESFDYSHVTPVSMWNPTPGLYTRYGKVEPLITALDDRFVIMGSGDELRLTFPAASLPPLRPGWTRDFLLLVDGWAKDADANTAYAQTVEPLPFHGMSAYPYPASEHFPEAPVHRMDAAQYNTRQALRLLRPLTPSGRASGRETQ